MSKMKLNPKKRNLIIIIAVLTVVILYFAIYYFMPMHISDKPVVLPADTISDHEIAVVHNELVTVNTKGVMCYDKTGEYQWDCALQTAAPFMGVADDYVVVADTENAEINILKDGTLYETIAETEQIAGIDVNENGYTAVVTGEPGYRSVVKVYNNFGNCIYKWYSGSVYVTALALSDNNKYMVAAGLDPNAEDVASSLYFFDLRQEKPMGEAVLKGSVAYKIIYDKKDAYILSDKGIYCYTKNGKLSHMYDFMGRNLHAFSFDDKKEIAVALNRADASGSMLSGSEILVFKDNLKVKGCADVDFEVTALDMHDGFVAAAGLRNVCVMRTSGIVKSRGELQSDCSSIKLFNGGKSFATLSDSTIHIYEVRFGF
ncbi:MAG: hypothetical protein IJE10_01850 [Clostridia bacterium]|nr:hypothetical protein [Clostridia bacterium]